MMVEGREKDIRFAVGVLGYGFSVDAYVRLSCDELLKGFFCPVDG